MDQNPISYEQWMMVWSSGSCFVLPKAYQRYSISTTKAPGNIAFSRPELGSTSVEEAKTMQICNVFKCVCVCVHTGILYVYTYIYIYIFIYKYTYRGFLRFPKTVVPLNSPFSATPITRPVRQRQPWVWTSPRRKG